MYDPRVHWTHRIDAVPRIGREVEFRLRANENDSLRGIVERASPEDRASFKGIGSEVVYQANGVRFLSFASQLLEVSVRAVRLVAALDEYDNTPGLKIVGVPDVDGMAVERTDGVLIAHDLLEHQNGLSEIGTVWDELEALGGIWQVRGRTGDMFVRNIHTPQVNIASDITRMFPDWQNETRRRVPVTSTPVSMTRISMT